MRKKRLLSLALASWMSLSLLSTTMGINVKAEENATEDATVVETASGTDAVEAETDETGESAKLEEVDDAQEESITEELQLVEEEVEPQTAVEWVEINETNFPDPNFRYLLEKMDSILDGKEDGKIRKDIDNLYFFSQTEGVTVHTNLPDKERYDTYGLDLTGIELFPDIEYIGFGGTNIYNLDFSKLPKLTRVECKGTINNNNIYMAENTNIEYMLLGASPRFSGEGCKNVKTLVLWETNCEKLDASPLASLEELVECHSKVKYIDITKNTKLKSIDLNGQESYVDFTNNTELEHISLGSEFYGGTELSEIDLSKNTKLKSFYSYGNNFECLDFTNNRELEYFSCYNNSPNVDAYLWNCSLLKEENVDVDDNVNLLWEKPVIPQVTVTYNTHIQTYGWRAASANGATSGTSGESKRLEAIKIDVSGADNLGVTYQTHVQSYGWQDWKNDGAISGTSGESKRLEAIRIKLTGANADKYDIFYRVHAQSYGWLGWAKNGASAGTAGQSLRLEAIQIVVLPKGETPTEACNAPSFIEIGKKASNADNAGMVNYMTHVQSYGDQSYVSDGSISGTSGESKRLEAIRIKLNNDLTGVSGGITYQTHIQKIGWQDWKSDGEMSGTSGKSYRLEAIRIKLTGEMEKKYDVYYRVHSQRYGWLGWAKNGEEAGTSGQSLRLEGIQIVLVPKGGAAPGSTSGSYIQK